MENKNNLELFDLYQDGYSWVEKMYNLPEEVFMEALLYKYGPNKDSNIKALKLQLIAYRSQLKKYVITTS